MTPSHGALLEDLGNAAANLVQDGMLVGLGTGSTAAAMIDALGKRVKDGLQITAVATSIATRDQAMSYGIPIADLAEVNRLDLCIDGADEIDPALNVVKGRGGALLFEKLVARQADRYVIIATAEKLVPHLGLRMPLPVEVVPVGWTHTLEIVAALGMSPTLRVTDGAPFVSDGGHVIADCGWPESILDPARLARDLKAITGVVDHGLFIDMVDLALTIDETGTLEEHHAS